MLPVDDLGISQALPFVSVMADSKFDFGSQPQSTRVDSMTGFANLPFTPMNAAGDDADNSKFSFSPPSDGLSFDPTSAAAFGEDLQQTTVHPGVLGGNGPSLSNGNDIEPENFFAPQMLFTSFSNSRSHHGQVTPPEDLSPRSAETKQNFLNSTEHNSSFKADKSEGSAKGGSKRRRSTKSNSGASSSKKRGRKASVVVEDDSLDPEDKAKRDQFLERNRVAAHKCRQKKKEWMVQLDNDFRDLSARNKFLQAELSVLNNTLYELKNLVFQHTDCGFGPLDDFISREAERVRLRARLGSDPSMSMQAPRESSGTFTHGRASFSGSVGSMDPRYDGLDTEKPIGRASTETSDFDSLRSMSTAPDGVMTEAWTDMIQQP